jgi:hypothetical protein
MAVQGVRICGWLPNQPFIVTRLAVWPTPSSQGDDPNVQSWLPFCEAPV